MLTAQLASIGTGIYGDDDIKSTALQKHASILLIPGSIAFPNNIWAFAVCKFLVTNATTFL